MQSMMKQFQYLVVAAEHGNLATAAALHVSQSSVSLAIARLEKAF